MEYKAKSIQVPAPAHAGVALGVVGIRDSEWVAKLTLLAGFWAVTSE
jgi:hypothetical protein